MSKTASITLASVLLAQLSLACALVASPVRTAAPRRVGRAPAPAADENAKSDLEEVTQKYGLEAGLFSAFKNRKEGGGMTKAKDLLKRYGGAYLLTSTTLAIISFSLCYVAVDNGVDVSALLQRVGIEVSSTSEKVGTVSIAYAVHKAASPIRFPPTVALTPVVAARLFGKAEQDDPKDE